MSKSKNVYLFWNAYFCMYVFLLQEKGFSHKKLNFKYNKYYIVVWNKKYIVRYKYCSKISLIISIIFLTLEINFKMSMEEKFIFIYVRITCIKIHK